MPNTNPQTTSLEALEEKFERARKSSYINYSFFFGATNTNAQLIEKVDIHSIPGIKIFMGASTGNMLVDRISALDSIFENAAKRDLPIMTHCEDSKMISDNMAVAKEQYGEDPPIALHPQIRSEEACYNSSSLAVELALKHKTNVHIAHITTAKELNLLRLPKVKDYVTMEAVIPHLWFAEEDYKTQGARIKCNPAIKKATDREALRKAIADGTITSVGTDHAPHLLEQKEGGAAKATSGMPMVQFSLVSMLELVDKGVLTIERMVELMCHAPAKLFKINHRGFLREQYKADIAIVQPHQTWTVDKDCIQSKCKWSPMEGQTYQWKVVHTICNGHHLYNQGEFDGTVKGQKLSFR